MGDFDGGRSAAFKARLYQYYLTQHVRLSTESVQSALVHRGPYLRWVIATCLPQDKSAKILDLGCGYGGMLHFLREAGYTNLAGVDVSSEQVELARHLGVENVHCQDVRTFLQATSDQTYKVIIAFDILEHFAKPELMELMDELRRVIAPGGWLVVHAPNGEGLFAGTILHGDLTHELAFTRSNLNQLGGAAGFRVIAVKEDVPVVHGLRSLVRNLLWRTGSFFLRVLAVAETGEGFRDKPMSRNLLAVLERVG